MNLKIIRWLFPLVALVWLTACDSAPPPDGTPAPATPTVPAVVEPTPEATPIVRDPNFVVVAMDAPNPPFGDIDPFGAIFGFDPDVMAELAAAAGFSYEFVITPYEGILESLTSHRDFSAVMSALPIPDSPPPGVVFTAPYLEVGHAVLVRANERAINSPGDLTMGTAVGVRQFSSEQETALNVLRLRPADLRLYNSVTAVVQALIDGEVTAVIIDSVAATHYANTYHQQLRLAGTPDDWIVSQGYGIAVAADNEQLLARLNQAIGDAHSEGAIDRLAQAWLLPTGTIIAGESLIGTLPNELVIGLALPLRDMDPAANDPALGSWAPDQLGWEVQMNVMSGLLMYNHDNELIPTLAADFPLISEDGLEYTFPLRSGLTFADGSEMTAEDVKWSVLRSARLGNWLVNGVLKNADGDALADEDSVQVLGTYTVKFVLQEPTAHFLSMLATPPFYILNRQCYALTYDPLKTCGGIGPYNIVAWEAGEYMRLKANPQWPGPGPAFENVQLRFYEDSARMRRAFEIGALDIAWMGLSVADILELREQPGYIVWEGPAHFKSYLVFEQGAPPWDDPRARQAVALAVDREALATTIFQGTRQPLYSPVPSGALGHAPTLPQRNLNQSRALLAAAGYTAERRLEIALWYVSDGRYSQFEREYAQALKEQLEETGVIAVTLQSAPYEIFRPQSIACNYPAYLLGWPPSGWPPNHMEPMSWLDYFITRTDRICSNYESAAMDALREAVLAETNSERRFQLYQEMQALWAVEYPTLDLLQEQRIALSLLNVANVGQAIDGMGLLHYTLLTKGAGAGE
jgi:peptide/nickel transport system substrate-binding protein